MSRGGWIKFDKDMVHDPRLVQAATELLKHYSVAHRTPGGCDELSQCDASRFVTHALRGALVTLWCYADEHIRDDDSLPCDVTSLDAIVGLEGFCDLLPEQWLAVRDDGCVVLPGYCAKNNIVSKRKSASSGAERTRRWREKKRRERDASRDTSHVASQVASHKRHCDVTVTVDQDQDHIYTHIGRANSGKETEGNERPISDYAKFARPLREAGVQVTSMHPLLVSWVDDEFTLKQAMQAVAVARENIKPPEPIPARYLDKVLRNPPRPSAGNGRARSRGADAHAELVAALDSLPPAVGDDV